ncbi:hypothetical protein [Sporosalibacterium faouarense]|uniref:hypothetical protein n=1 Tax=Sporosalibacterium faouarense TaxID=516123 RepID=UPI00141D12BE|nr:hypothetical protein [Sporosalibacterium faouarense]MTI47355.1 hypothetical protein [Bacillota bacterium]
MKKIKLIIISILSIMFISNSVVADDYTNKDYEVEPMIIPMNVEIETSKDVYTDTEIVYVTIYIEGGIRDLDDPILYDCVLTDNNGTRLEFESDGNTSLSISRYDIGEYTLTITAKSSLGYYDQDSTTFTVIDS